MMEIIMVRSTSCTEARITSVRSITTSSFSEGEIEERSHGSVCFTLSAVSIMFAPGCLKIAMITPGFPPGSPRLRMSSDDQRLVLVGLEKLIGIGNRKGAILVGQRAFGEIRVRRLQRLAHLLQADAIAVELLRVHLYPDRGTRGAPHKNLPNAIHLRQFLRHDGVRRVVNLRNGNGVGNE